MPSKRQREVFERLVRRQLDRDERHRRRQWRRFWLTIAAVFVAGLWALLACIVLRTT